MAQCKTCGRRYYLDDWDCLNYCSDECWKSSDEYKYYTDLVSKFVKSLNKKQTDMFKEILSSDESGGYLACIEL